MTDERRIVAGQTFHTVFCGSPLIRGNKRNTEQWASTGQRMDCLSQQNSSLIGPKNPAKFENDSISRSVHRFKITEPNLTILVSFSSAEDVLSNVKKCDIFGLQGTENLPFRFFWDTRYMGILHGCCALIFVTNYEKNIDVNVCFTHPCYMVNSI